MTNPDEQLLLDQLAGELKPTKLPEWLELASLPPLRWRDGRLAPIEPLVIAGLRKYAIDGESEHFSSLRNRLDPTAAAELTWAVFDRWNRAGGAPAHKWCLYALGTWGDENAARTLGRLVRDWPNQRKFKRAEQGLEVLERMGTDVAFSEMDTISQVTKSPALRNLAAARLRSAAKKRGLTADELGDRLVPTYGMDMQGKLLLDFGPRQFTAQLESDFTLTLLDAAGKIRKSVPKAAGDDPAKSSRAVELLKAARKGLRDQLGLQAVRLERAMVEERRWTPSDWQQFILQHPLQRRLAQRLLWYAEADGARTLFRVAEDWTLADDEEQMLELTGHHSVGLVHPLNLTEEVKFRWRTIFEDYEISSPVEQLTRQIYLPTAEESRTVACERYVGYMIDGRQLISQLARYGWRQGTPRAYGSLFVHSRPYPAANVTAVLHHGGVLLGYYEEAIESALGPVMFIRGCLQKVDEHVESPELWVAIREVPAIAFSETLRDVHRVAQSGTGFDPDWKKKMGLQ